MFLCTLPYLYKQADVKLIDVTDKRRARELAPAISLLFETMPAIYFASFLHVCPSYFFTFHYCWLHIRITKWTHIQSKILKKQVLFSIRYKCLIYFVVLNHIYLGIFAQYWWNSWKNYFINSESRINHAVSRNPFFKSYILQGI